MSHSRISPTPFDDEPDRHLVDALRRRFDQRDRRKKKNLERLDQLFKEIRDGYEGRVELSYEREAEITAILARVLENGRRLAKDSENDREIRELVHSRVAMPSDAGALNPREQNETVNQSVNGTVPAATRHNIHTSHQNQPQRQTADANGPATTTTEQRSTLYDDLMPENGIRCLSPTEREILGDRLLQQMIKINSERRRTISLEHCRSVFGNRQPFRYRNYFYIANCPVHPNEVMDYQGATNHYLAKHCVKNKRYLEREAVRFLGTKIVGKEDYIRRFFRETRTTDEQPYNGPFIPEDAPRRMVTLRTSALRAALATAQPETQSSNETTCNDTSRVAARENAMVYTEPAPFAEVADAGDMSPPTVIPTENISMGIAASPDSCNWTPTWPAAVREATPEHPETNTAPGSNVNPFIVSDNEEMGSSSSAAAAVTAARDPHTPSPVRVKMQGSPGGSRRRLGVKGVQLSPSVFRSRTPTGAWPSNDAQETASEQEQPQQQQQTLPGDSAESYQTASPPPSRRTSAQPIYAREGRGGAVEELTRIVNRSIAQHRFVSGACRTSTKPAVPAGGTGEITRDNV